MSVPVILTGRLGWSNKRGGIEIYNDQGEDRWGDRLQLPDEGWGDLLADHLEAAGAYEGSYIIVIAFPGERSADRRNTYVAPIAKFLGRSADA